MADDRYRREYPQHIRPEDNQAQAQHYHRASGEESRHGAEPPRTMAASVTLPSIHDSRGGGYGSQPPPSRGYPSDPRYASPNAVNGYPPPGGQQGHPSGYLPPMPPQSDPRGAPYPPSEQRPGYYDDRRHQYPPEYPPEAYYYRGQPPPNGYPRDYRGPPPGAYPPEYAQGAPPQMAQAAPRQRTSIACRYCRKRKIRCSGYQSAPGGKCQNCARMNQECIFQPVSSSSSTAFIPISAVPGGVPPGTQLFGSYGQPLPNSAPGGHPYPPHSGGAPPPPAGYYAAPGQSPTEPYATYGEHRSEDGSQSAAKRSRDPMERDDEWRRPPPRGAADEEPRRRSPAEFSSKSSPGAMSYPYRGAGAGAGAGHSPRSATQAPAGRPAGGRSPSGQNGSSGTSTPSQQAASTASQSQQAPTSVMSLSNLVDKSDIDKTMIDRLNRPPYPGHRKEPSR